MINKIYNLKDKLLTKIEEEMQDMSRLDVREIGTLIDAVHHLAETEYYCSVADAMWADKHGYGNAMGGDDNITQARRGYTETPMRSGYAMASRGSMGHDHIIEQLGNEYRKLSPEDRMMMKSKVLSTLGGM